MAFSRDERSRFAGRPSLRLQKNELRKQYLEKRKADEEKVCTYVIEEA
jgi:hypothetical protein